MALRLPNVWVCALFLAWGAGCSVPRGPVSIDSDDPDLKVLAIKRDVELHDDKDDPQMVRDLDDDDPAVRFYAIQGLYHLTGETLGYRYYDGKDARVPAIARWRQWLKSHRVR